jgi:hypothetical protein
MYLQFQMTASDYIFHQLINNNQLLYLTTSQQQHSVSRQLTHSSGDMLPLQSSRVHPHSAHFNKLILMKHYDR